MALLRYDPDYSRLLNTLKQGAEDMSRCLAMRLGGLAGVSVLVSLTGCTPPGLAGSGTTVTDSAGIVLTTGPAEDRPLDWTLTELFRLGGEDEGPGSFTAAHQASVGTDAAGRIYVLDGHTYQVQVFDRDGRHLRTQGGRGGGPGEFQMHGFLLVHPSGVTSVFDFPKRSLVRWDADGSVLPEIRFEGFFPSPRTWLSGDTLIHVHEEYEEQRRITSLRFVIAGDTTKVPGVESRTSGMVMFSCVGLNLPPLFSPQVVHATTGAMTAMTTQVPYRVDLFAGTQLVRSVRRDLAPEPATVRHVERLYPEGMKISFGGGRECVVAAAELLEKQSVASHLPMIQGMAFGPDGELWVQRYTFSDEPSRVDVFDVEGRYLGTLMGRPLPLGFIGEDLVLFPEEDEATGVVQVVGYRVARREG